MKIVFRIAVLAAVIGLGFWIYLIFFPPPEKAIRKQLAKVARLASVNPDQSILSRGASIQELANCFDSEVDITVNLPSGSKHSVTGRDGIIETSKLAHGSLKYLQIDFLDMNVSLAPDNLSATVNLTAKITSSEEREFQALELKITLKKINGQWLIIRIENVRTLSRLRKHDAPFVARA